MPLEIEVKELPSFRIAAVATDIAPNDSVAAVTAVLGEPLMNWAAEIKLAASPIRGVQCISLLHGDWASYIRDGAPIDRHIPIHFVQGLFLGQEVETLASLKARLRGNGSAAKIGLSLQHTPGGLYGVTRYVGPYDSIRAGLVPMLRDWLPASGYHYAGGPLVELYGNDARYVHPDELVTDLCVPVNRVGTEARHGTLALI